ncbi:hypothetical protein GCM10022421_05580 [Oceanisphaera sediminis]|uniref:diguanylate cyclase n=2 Tax=Oceanisphaera sediminis TaxID=981381 RepID=A0ABP7D7S4_9GAMM
MLKRFLWWLLLAWTVLAAVLWVSKKMYDKGLQQQALSRHQHLMNAAKTTFHEHLMVAVQNTRLLSTMAFDLGYPDAPAGENRQRLTQAFINSASIFGRYDQIRIIDLQGQERIRINNTNAGPVAVPESGLQNKRHRYYIQQGLKLAPGQVYLSPLDLNTEQGELEKPFKPTIRLVGMMQNTRGEPAGLLVLNLRAAAMLNQFIELFPQDDRAMLLNADGYWMVNHDSVNEWGWMRERPDLIAATWQPELWQEMQTNRHGTANIQNNLFSYLWLDMANIYEKTVGGRYASNLGLISDLWASQWLMMVQTAPRQWQSGAIYLHPWFKAALAGLFMMVLVKVYLLVRNKHHAREKARLEQMQLEYFRDLYENAPIGYVTLAEDGRISNINKQALKYLGYRREELINRLKLIELVDNEVQKDAPVLLENMFKDEKHHFRVTMKTKQGAPQVMSCSVSSRLNDERTLELSRFSMQNVTEQARLEQQLQQLAYKDPLTGAANRRRFYEQAEREMIRANRNGSPLTVLTLDIDHFKKVNDTYGHDAGDEVLIALAEHCRLALRRTDILARFGGEEFVILLPDTPLQQGAHKAELIRRTLAELPVTVSSGAEIRFAVSLGVATLSSRHQGIKDLLQSADEALYQAKNSGRNRVCMAGTPEKPDLLVI